MSVTVVLVLRSVFQRNTLNIVEKQQLYLYKWTVFDAFYTIWRTIEGKSRVKPVGEQRSNLPNDTDVSYYSWL